MLPPTVPARRRPLELVTASKATLALRLRLLEQQQKQHQERSRTHGTLAAQTSGALPVQQSHPRFGYCDPTMTITTHRWCRCVSCSCIGRAPYRTGSHTIHPALRSFPRLLVVVGERTVVRCMLASVVSPNSGGNETSRSFVPVRASRTLCWLSEKVHVCMYCHECT